MLTNLDNVVRYTVSGNTYAITYPYWSTEEIKAYITLSDGTVSGLTYGTDFTVTAPNGVNGTLTKVSAWTDAEKVTIVREVELTQEIDLINGEKIDGEQLETGLDLKTAGLQQLNEKFTRSVMTSIDETGDNMVIPNSTARKGTGDGTLLGFDGTGGNIVLRDLKQFDADVANTAANATASANSATLANKWAENPVDTPVEPGNYSAKHWASKASTSAGSASVSAYNADQSAEDSEAFAVGERGGVPVGNTDPTYHNNSKYYYQLVAQLISGALRYQGTWTTTGATDYSGIPTPRVKGDMYYCQGTACTIDGVTYTQGDLIIFNQDVASTITTSAIDKIDNTETVTPDNLVELTNKTINSKDNKIRNTAKELPTGTTINAEGDTSYTFNANNAVVTLGTAPYIGCRVTVVTWGYYGYVLYKFGSSWKCIYVSAGQRLDFTNTGTGVWRLNDGQCLLVPNTDAITLAPNNPDTSTQMLPNDWREDYGCNEFTVGYAASSIIISNYATPDDRCVVKVMGTYSRRVAQAYKWQITGSPTPIWINKKHDSTWEGWQQISTDTETATLKNKTIDAHDNTILSTELTPANGDTINPTGFCTIALTTSNEIVTIGSCTTRGTEVIVNGYVGYAYIKFKNQDGTLVAVALKANQSIKLIRLTGNNDRWNVEAGCILGWDAGMKTATDLGIASYPNDWRVLLGVGEYSYHYDGTGTDAIFGLPLSTVDVSVTMYSSTRGTAIAQRWSTNSTGSSVWGCHMQGTWSTFWTRFDGTAGGSGTVHEITSGFINDYSGTVKWYVTNGICFATAAVSSTSSYGGERNILDSGLPKAKISPCYFAGIEGDDYVFIHNNASNTELVSCPYTNTGHTINVSISYPVADGWVES